MRIARCALVSLVRRVVSCVHDSELQFMVPSPDTATAIPDTTDREALSSFPMLSATLSSLAQ